MAPARKHLRRFSWVLLLAVSCGTALTLPGCSPGDDGWPEDKSGPKVVTSFAPLYCFAVNVAGDDAVVRNLLTTSGPHHFQPTDREARILRRADIFLVNGIGLEGEKPQKMIDSSGNGSLKLIELGGRVPEDMLCEGSCQHDHGDGHDHEHGDDPHVWLSPDYAILMVEGIRDELKAADPEHAEGYDRRAEAYIGKLRELKQYGLDLLKDKHDRRIVTFHDSLAYFAQTYDIKVVGVVQKNPGSEPNDRELKTLIALCASEPYVRVICTEPQYANSNAGTALVEELKAKGVPEPALVEFNTLETVPADHLTPEWYEQQMKANLEALAKVMK